MSTSINIRNLRKTYRNFVAVDDLTLDIPAGSVFGLLGPNGAGKTTTFKAMLNLIRHDSGNILYNGLPLVPETFEHVAYVPERDVLYDWMTVAEHVEMNRRAFKQFSAAKAFDLVAQFSVDRRKKAGKLSKGMRTATTFALAIARQADVLILDEPTSGLDPINQRHVLNLIINESVRGATILFSSHQIGQVERAAERIAVLDRGKLVLEGAIDDLKFGRKIVEGIFPSPDAPLNGIADDKRLVRIDRDGRIVRLLTLEASNEFAAKLEAMGASGVRILDLNLEDIFINAVSPTSSTSDVVVGA